MKQKERPEGRIQKVIIINKIIKFIKFLKVRKEFKGEQKSITSSKKQTNRWLVTGSQGQGGTNVETRNEILEIHYSSKSLQISFDFFLKSWSEKKSKMEQITNGN